MGKHGLDGHEAPALDALFQPVEELASPADVHALTTDPTLDTRDPRVEGIVGTRRSVGDHAPSLVVPGVGIEPTYECI